MKPGEAVMKLTALGYRLEVVGELLRWRYAGLSKPDAQQVRPLLEVLKAHKDEVKWYLTHQVHGRNCQSAQAQPSTSPAPPERVLTCYDCPYFEPSQGPNPRQAWGHCLKREKGQYGCATACEAALSDDGARA